MPKLCGEYYPSSQGSDKNVDKHLAFRRMTYTTVATVFQELCKQQTEHKGERRCLEGRSSRAKSQHQGCSSCQRYSLRYNTSSRARHTLQ